MTQVVDYHQYLIYYPHPETLRTLLMAVAAKRDSAASERVSEIFRKRKLLKVNARVKEALSKVFEQISDEQVRESSAALINN